MAQLEELQKVWFWKQGGKKPPARLFVDCLGNMTTSKGANKKHSVSYTCSFSLLQMPAY